MRINWNAIKICLLALSLAMLYAFASARNANRISSKPVIKFIGEENLYISYDTVSKLLIQNRRGTQNVTKETLDLSTLEATLRANEMIKSAEVYLTVDGVLTAEVIQKTPLARVYTNVSYYIDDTGQPMPLSHNHTARVPLVTGHIKKTNLNQIYKVAQKIQADTFLKKHIIEVHQSDTNQLYLKMRDCRFVVKLGDTTAFDKKINNLKAFYIQALKTKTFKIYSLVNLEFENQVVCTKK